MIIFSKTSQKGSRDKEKQKAKKSKSKSRETQSEATKRTKSAIATTSSSSTRNQELTRKRLHVRAENINDELFILPVGITIKRSKTVKVALDADPSTLSFEKIPNA